MPPPTSNFLKTGQPDPRLAQTAQTPFDATARQVLDQQVVDVQTLLAQLVANGVLGSYVQIDPTSPVDIRKGDVLCRSAFLARGSAVLATPANLAAAGGSVLGVALDAVTKGSRCPYASAGVLPPEATGLAPAPGSPKLARVSALGRVESVGSLGPSDTPLGGIDSSGWLTLFPGGTPQQASPGIYRGTATTTDGTTPTPILAVPLSDNAVLTGSLYILAATVGVGRFQHAEFGFGIEVVGGVLAAFGGPAVVTSNTYGGGPPSFTSAYAANLITVSVTGIAATTISWNARLDVVSVLT